MNVNFGGFFQFFSSKSLQNFIYFASAQFWKQTTKPRLILWSSLKEITAADKIWVWKILNDSSKIIQKVFGNI